MSPCCHCEPPACDPLRLTLQEVTGLKLSWSKLGRALCAALSLDPKPDTLNLYNTQQIGSWSPSAIPVILTIQLEPFQFRNAVAELVAQLRQPFILLAPTTGYLDAHCQTLQAGVGAACFGLDSTVRLTPQGTLLATKPPGELFAQFRPEPQEAVAEETARQVWALARRLDAGSGQRKAPPLRVFLLYCKDGLSAGDIAQRCHCGKGLVFIRLRWLRAKLGCNLEDLRQYSEHFQKMEESLSRSAGTADLPEGGGVWRGRGGGWLRVEGRET